MSARAYALSDGNSFYCSCERVFDARLAKVPVIVLSNNDGCAIARTPEAKALGIRMGEPFFKIREMCRVQGVRVYSSNYALYGDMSARVNTVYRGFSPRIEIYSIDESFLDLSDVREADRVTLCRDRHETVRAWTGIPTCVGIGATKTLAKLANHVAKKVPELGGVCDLTDPIQYDHWMARIPPEDIWGVGPANARNLEALGCESVADVRDLDTRAVRKAMTVVGERLVQELRGMARLDLEEVAPTRKGCAVTRSFSDRVEDLATMKQAVATHAARLGEKLRAGGLATDHVTVFFHTSEHDRDRPQRSVSSVVTLPEASNDTLVLVEGVPARRSDDLAGRVPLFQGRGRHHGPRTACGLAAGLPGLGATRPGVRGCADGGARRLQSPLRARSRRPGECWVRAQAGVEHQIRDEVAPLHHSGRRAAGGEGRLNALRAPQSGRSPGQPALLA